MNDSKKILVIGSSGHKFADQCVSWYQDIPYLGDYDLVVVNIQGLSQKDLKNKKVITNFCNVRDQINDIIWANTYFICITCPTVNSGGFWGRERFPVMSNYHWCPIYLNFSKLNGSSFEEEEDGYFKFVKKWTHFLDSQKENYYGMFNYKARMDRNFVDDPMFEPILKNRAQKMIAFEVKFSEFNKDHFGRKKDIRFSNTITFLPPPTEINIEDAIDFLLKKIGGFNKKNSQLPSWTEKIEVYEESKIRDEIKEKEQMQLETKKKLKKLYFDLGKLINYKKLLSEDGIIELENIVEESLKLVDIEVNPGPKGKEDRILLDPSNQDKIPLEITGSSKSISERKLTQLIGRLSSEEYPESRTKCRGLLIGNHYKNKPLNNDLSGRNKAFEPGVIDKAKSWNICLLSTLELFKAVNAKLEGKNLSSFLKGLFNGKGEIRFK